LISNGKVSTIRLNYSIYVIIISIITPKRSAIAVIEFAGQMVKNTSNRVEINSFSHKIGPPLVYNLIAILLLTEYETTPRCRKISALNSGGFITAVPRRPGDKTNA
jgi:hypothetical protein